jgi:hypothetical protein
LAMVLRRVKAFLALARFLTGRKWRIKVAVFNLFNIGSEPKDKNKIYSLHEPDVYVIAKGKDHKQYEYGNKVSIVFQLTFYKSELEHTD